MNCTCKDCLYIPPYNVLNYIGNEQNFNPTYPHDWTDPTININNIESNNQKILDNWKNNSWFCNYNIFDTMNEKNYNYQMFYHCIPPYQHDKNITMFPIINTPRK